MSSPFDIPNAEQYRVNHGLKSRIRHMEVKKKARELWSAYLRTDTKLYEGANEVEYSKYVGKVACDVKAVLEIRQINFTDGEDNLPRLHINVYDALIRKHVCMAPTKF